MNTYYLSFLEPGVKWLGGAYVRGESLIHAHQRSHAVGCNPGGEVKVVEIDPEVAKRVPEDKFDRLLDEKEIEF